MNDVFIARPLILKDEILVRAGNANRKSCSTISTDTVRFSPTGVIDNIWSQAWEKGVVFYPGNYFKNKAILEYYLSSYPTVKFAEF